MQVVVLGSAGYHPNDRRHTTCVLLPEAGVAFDAGTAFFRVGRRLTTDTLDIFLSHAHLDHVAGLTFLFDVLRDHPLHRTTLHATPEVLAAIREHLLAPALFPVELPLEMRPLTPEFLLPGQGRVTHFPLEHPGGSRGYRIDWPDRSMAFVTDTTARPNAPYVSRIAGVDLLLHECNFRDGEEEFAAVTGHSSTSAVARTARAACVKRLVLLHLNPLETSDDPVGLEDARSIFPATELAVEEESIEF